MNITSALALTTRLGGRKAGGLEQRHPIGGAELHHIKSLGSVLRRDALGDDAFISVQSMPVKSAARSRNRFTLITSSRLQTIPPGGQNSGMGFASARVVIRIYTASQEPRILCYISCEQWLSRLAYNAQSEREMSEMRSCPRLALIWIGDVLLVLGILLLIAALLYVVFR